MKILLTGSSGFIGRHIQEAWRNKYDLYSPSHQKLDLLDLGSVERYLTDHYFDVVIHAANINNVRRQVNDHQILDGNLRMFCNLERCRSKYGKMYYFGSGAEYDMRHYVPQMPETYFGRHIPVDPYGFSKYMMSMLSNGNIYDLRLFGVFGHHEEWRRRFISNVIYQNLAGKSVQMRQNMYFDYIYIDDLLRILEWFLTHEPKRHHYNVCSGQKIDLYSLAQMVTQETGIAASIQVAQRGWKPEYTGDSRRLCEEFGALELTPMPTAIHEMVTYYRNNGFTDH